MLCVRWYLRYCLTLRDVEELMMERGLTVDHSTIGRWVLRYAPELNKRVRREIRQPNRSWRVDETYVRVGGAWTYLYRAVDSTGETITSCCRPSAMRWPPSTSCKWRCGEQARSDRVLSTSTDTHPIHRDCTIEAKWRVGSPLSMPTCPYLNNVPRQDHRFVKKRVCVQSLVPVRRGRVANDRRIRSDEYDPQGTSEVVGQGRCGGPETLH